MKNKLRPLPGKFYLRDTITVAKDLLGKTLVRKIKGKTLTAKIVETEAYIGSHDPASHAYQKITERNKVMYDTGGKVYVYFIYGNYFCFNVVCEKKGIGNAVLVRAVEPLSGLEVMKRNRGKMKSKHDLTNGPAKLCLAMKIDRTLYGEDLTNEKNVFVSKPIRNEKFEIATTKRIGINVGIDFPYRFFIRDNQYVTKHKYNKLKVKS